MCSANARGKRLKHLYLLAAFDTYLRIVNPTIDPSVHVIPALPRHRIIVWRGGVLGNEVINSRRDAWSNDLSQQININNNRYVELPLTSRVAFSLISIGEGSTGPPSAASTSGSSRSKSNAPYSSWLSELFTGALVSAAGIAALRASKNVCSSSRRACPTTGLYARPGTERTLWTQPWKDP